MSKVDMEYLKMNGEHYYKIQNSDKMRPFFMSIVSDSNHWLFISSNGALTAGRKNSAYALFPYYTDDKITESFETTGSKTIYRVSKSDNIHIWEPFSDRYTGVYHVTRNVYKNEYGNKVIFEEINNDLGLAHQCEWNSSNEFGFVKKTRLINKSNESQTVKLLDGIQNIMPYGVDPDLQQASSNLVDAYKRSELLPDAGVGIYALSAIIIDRAEPSEALKANVVWSKGLENPIYLLSSIQLNTFRKSGEIHQEYDRKAEKGAYFVVDTVQLAHNEQKDWMLVADVNKSTAEVINLSQKIQHEKDIATKVLADVELGTKKLVALTSAADGKQLTADKRRNTRHYANVLFNLMRGGIFDDNYAIEATDFLNYLSKANRTVYSTNKHTLEALPTVFSQNHLKAIALQSTDKDFRRLCLEYLPLKFSRRHGDPSRPWNKFSINTQTEDGKKVLDYQGNWRDIFQNWEALVHAYPAYIDSMICKFLNASTFDGYNPYRVTKDGFDWETIEPDDPWSYIGYWGDHQIIYLLKFLEFNEKHFPGNLGSYLNECSFVYANVPYKIKNYQQILENPKDTIIFDTSLDAEIRKRRNELGADGALLRAPDSAIYKVTLTEKLLATVLSKVSNFIPEAGIWMNTQRPEWNDANNALVGNGVSMVTLYYLRRFLTFFNEILAGASETEFRVSIELKDFFMTIVQTLERHQACLSSKIDNTERKAIMDGLGEAASTFRTTIYKHGFSAEVATLTKGQLQGFMSSVLGYLHHTIKANKREDALYHAYNLITIENDTEVSVSHLSEMLEGQVAVLSAGYLSAQESVDLLEALKHSALFREDQYSYILYPNKNLPGFAAKNTISPSYVEKSELIKQLVQHKDTSIVEVDVLGNYHFNGSFNNAESLKKALSKLPKATYGALVEQDTALLLGAFESTFDHKSFTGRSGTFFGYEGLGSIYWHMVSKLVLAIQETCLKAIEDKESDAIIGKLLDHYYEANEGIGVHKSPELYGAFPTDPYSHTPANKGAQQPGMTGQVKEDVLSRFGELGVFVTNGQLGFNPHLLRKEEFLKEARVFSYVDSSGADQEIQIPKNSLAFTYCQVPVVYKIADKRQVKVRFANGEELICTEPLLSKEISKKIFERTAEVVSITVALNL